MVFYQLLHALIFQVLEHNIGKAKDEDGRTVYSLSLVDKVLEIVNKTNPKWWVLENPVGRLQKLRPILGKPYYFNPSDFGDPYTKKKQDYLEILIEI